MSADAEIEAWLSQLGFSTSADREKARAELVAAGLTREGKQRISEAKLPRGADILRAKFCVHCAQADCVAYAKNTGRVPVPSHSKLLCERCGGSNNRRKEDEFVAAFLGAGAKKLIVVGGSPSVREELEQALGKRLQLRMVDGTERRPIERAKADLEWADLVLLWGASELHHKVSMQYTNAGVEQRKKIVNVHRRGIEALLQAGIEHFSRLASNS